MAVDEFNITYAVLEGTNYDNLAEAMALLDRNCGKLERKLGTLEKQLRVTVNQLNLYVRNAVYPEYDCEEHSVLFKDDEMSVYLYEDVRRAVVKLHEQDDEFVDEEYSAFFGYFDDDCDGEVIGSMDDLLEYLPTPLFTTRVTPKQVTTFRNLAGQYDGAFQQRSFVANKLAASHDSYEEIVKTIVVQAESDERYDFSVDEHKLIVIRDKATCRHGVIYCTIADADEILGVTDGMVKTEVIDAIAVQIRTIRAEREACEQNGGDDD